MNMQEWTGYPDEPEAARMLPRDLTADDAGFGPACAAEHPSSGYICTRNDGHTGRHAAGNGDYIVAVWA